MKHLHIACLCAGVAAVSFAGISIAADTPTASTVAKPNIALPVTDLKFSPTSVFAPNGAGPLQAAPAFGDLAKGAHATFVKMPAGFVGAVHTHTDDFYAVVITGVAVNTAVGDKDVPLAAGSYWFQPGGKPHVTKCISATECIFFVNQSSKFDYLVVNH